jgi:hypothetical protein
MKELIEMLEDKKILSRKYVISRVKAAQSQVAPMSNYGVVIAYLAGILDKIDLR